MRPLLSAAVMVGLALALAASSRAQSCDGACMWVTLTATYNSGSNDVVLRAGYDQSSDVTIYYDFAGFSAQASDTLKSGIQNPDASAPSDWNISSPPMSDTYSVSASVSATLDPYYDDCSSAPCAYYPECGFSGGGFTCGPIPCSNCPSGNMPGAVGDSNFASTTTPSCPQDTDGNASVLENEYWHPSLFNITSPVLWKPDSNCDGIVSTNPTPYSNSYVFSPSNPQQSSGSVTDWGIFQQALLTGLSNINSTTPPSSVSGIPGTPPTNPVPISATGGVLYRTPTFQFQQHGSLDYSHDYGLGADLGSTSSNWTTVAAWVEWSNGSSPGTVKGNVCIEPMAESTAGHVHADWRTGISLQCPTKDKNGFSWVTDYMTGNSGNTWPAH